MKKEKISNACKNAFSVVEILVSLIVLSALSAVFAPMITKRLNVKSVNVKLPKMVVTTDCKSRFGEDCMLCNNNSCLVRQHAQEQEKNCPDGSVFVPAEYNGTGGVDLCVMKVNAQDMPGYEQSFYLTQVPVNTSCSSNTEKCSWSGATAGSSTATDGLSSTYSGANRPVNNFPAAQEICAYFATSQTKQKDWRLPTQAELTGWKNNISNVSISKGYSGLQLCDSSSSSGSAKCAISSNCTGANGSCSPSSVWGQGNTYLNLAGGAANVATGNASSAYSTRCVIPYDKINDNKIPYYECEEYHNPAPGPKMRCYNGVTERQYYLGKDFDGNEHFCTDSITNSSYEMYKCGFVNGSNTVWTDDEYPEYTQHNMAYVMGTETDIDDLIETGASSNQLYYCYTTLSSGSYQETLCADMECDKIQNPPFYRCRYSTGSDTYYCSNAYESKCQGGNTPEELYYCDESKYCHSINMTSASYMKCYRTDSQGVHVYNNSVCPSGTDLRAQSYSKYQVCTRGKRSCYTNRTTNEKCTKYSTRANMRCRTGISGMPNRYYSGWFCEGTACYCVSDGCGVWRVNWYGGTNAVLKIGRYYCNNVEFDGCDEETEDGEGTENIVTYYCDGNMLVPYSDCRLTTACLSYKCGPDNVACLSGLDTVSADGYSCSDGSRYTYCKNSSCYDWATTTRRGRTYKNRSSCTSHSSDRRAWSCSGRACWCGRWKVNWYGGTRVLLNKGWYCNDTSEVSIARFSVSSDIYKSGVTCVESSTAYRCKYNNPIPDTFSSCIAETLPGASATIGWYCEDDGKLYSYCDQDTTPLNETIYQCCDSDDMCSLSSTIPQTDCSVDTITYYQCGGTGDTYEAYDTITKISYQCDSILGADTIQTVDHPLYYCGADTTTPYESYETKTGFLCGSDTTVYVKCTKK